jgi:hypothetical protein
MRTRVFTKTVEINGVGIVLRSLDGVRWSSNLKDLKRFEAGRKASRSVVQRAFKKIGVSDRWGMSQGRKRRA